MYRRRSSFFQRGVNKASRANEVLTCKRCINIPRRWQCPSVVSNLIHTHIQGRVSSETITGEESWVTERTLKIQSMTLGQLLNLVTEAQSFAHQVCTTQDKSPDGLKTSTYPLMLPFHVCYFDVMKGWLSGELEGTSTPSSLRASCRPRRDPSQCFCHFYLSVAIFRCEYW